jgi:hypothetical protein
MNRYLGRDSFKVIKNSYKILQIIKNNSTGGRKIWKKLENSTLISIAPSVGESCGQRKNMREEREIAQSVVK